MNRTLVLFTAGFPYWLHDNFLDEELVFLAKQFEKIIIYPYLQGKIETRRYTDKEGIERFQTQIVGNDMQMLDSKKSANDANGNVKFVPMQIEEDDDVLF